MDECLRKLQELIDSLIGKSTEDYEFQWGEVKRYLEERWKNELKVTT